MCRTWQVPICTLTSRRIKVLQQSVGSSHRRFVQINTFPRCEAVKWRRLRVREYLRDAQSDIRFRKLPTLPWKLISKIFLESLLSLFRLHFFFSFFRSIFPLTDTNPVKFEAETKDLSKL